MSLCLACSNVNQSNAKFCAKCGTRLLIQDRYRAFKVIGQGGFGKTFLAQDEGKPSQPKCVIKQFTYTGVGMQKASELFQQEAEQLDKLGKHAQIPELLAHTEQDERQYLVQEFIDGQNIAQELVEQGAFNETKIREFLLDLLPVLDFLHSHQVIHRDIKPENIIRRRSDQKLVLVDFGAAKQATLTALVNTGTVIGTMHYAAPEQVRGKATFASDIYSLGVTCLNLLTLTSPFDLQDSDGEWIWRNFLKGGKISPELGAILDKTLARLSKRYNSAQAMLEVLNPSRPSSPIPQVTISHPSAKPQVITSSTANAKTISLDCGNGIRLELVSIPTGSFLMGSSPEEGDDDERPQHRVKVVGFQIGKYTITQAQYEALMGSNPSYFKGRELPVDNVSWYDTIAFCAKLTQQSGRMVRLPSEAEWEYACRADSISNFSFGNDSKRLGEYAWYCENSNNQNHPVGQKKPNNWGLYDMNGNVWEWCEDRWHENYNGASTDGKAWITGGYTSKRLLRGGSWKDSSNVCRAASRYSSYAVSRFYDYGFRVVCTL